MFKEWYVSSNYSFLRSLKAKVLNHSNSFLFYDSIFRALRILQSQPVNSFSGCRRSTVTITPRCDISLSDCLYIDFAILFERYMTRFWNSNCYYSHSVNCFFCADTDTLPNVYHKCRPWI